MKNGNLSGFHLVKRKMKKCRQVKVKDLIEVWVL